jgi:hypothetical protein
MLAAVKESSYSKTQINILKKAQQNAFFEKDEIVKPRMTLPLNKNRKNMLNEEESKADITNYVSNFINHV